MPTYAQTVEAGASTLSLLYTIQGKFVGPWKAKIRDNKYVCQRISIFFQYIQSAFKHTFPVGLSTKTIFKECPDSIPISW